MQKLVVTITGPDARKALAELVSNCQYEKLNVILVVTTPKDAQQVYRPWGNNYEKGLDK